MTASHTKICAGIILYNPDITRLYEVVNAIYPQVKELILVNNGSENLDDLHFLVSRFDQVYLINNNLNLGIAKALNQICAYAEKKNYKWCLTLDQDTICHMNMVERLLDYEEENNVGILCPLVDYEGLDIKQKDTSTKTAEVKGCMTSGSLTLIEAWKTVGGFKESYFIDFVDNEFCKRLTLNGFRIIRVNGCIMHHQLGESKQVKLGTKTKYISKHSPIRYYYMTRNNVFFIKDYIRQLNVPKEIIKLLSIIYEGVLYSDQRCKTFKFIMLGLKDAICNNEGKIPEKYL